MNFLNIEKKHDINGISEYRVILCVWLLVCIAAGRSAWFSEYETVGMCLVSEYYAHDD